MSSTMPKYTTSPATKSICTSEGNYPVVIGQSFTIRSGEVWQVKGWSGTTSYSPNGLFGTPGVVCENVESHNIDIFCGDSVATLLRDKPYG